MTASSLGTAPPIPLHALTAERMEGEALVEQLRQRQIEEGGGDGGGARWGNGEVPWPTAVPLQVGKADNDGRPQEPLHAGCPRKDSNSGLSGVKRIVKIWGWGLAGYLLCVPIVNSLRSTSTSRCVSGTPLAGRQRLLATLAAPVLACRVGATRLA